MLKSHSHILLLAARIIARLGIHTLEIDVWALAAFLLLVVFLMCHDHRAIMLHLAPRIRNSLISIHGAKSGPSLCGPSGLAAITLRWEGSLDVKMRCARVIRGVALFVWLFILDWDGLFVYGRPIEPATMTPPVPGVVRFLILAEASWRRLSPILTPVAPPLPYEVPLQGFWL